MPANERTRDDIQTKLEAIQELRTANTAGAGGIFLTNRSRVKKKPRKMKSSPTAKEIFAEREVMLGRINIVRERLKNAEEIMLAASGGQSSNDHKQTSTEESLHLTDV